MSGRVLERKKRRLPCKIHFRSQKFNGMVIDVSAMGIFIQTSAKVARGEALELEVGVPGQEAAIPLGVEVVRRKRVPDQLLALAQGGLGARITRAPEAYYEYLLSLDPVVAESKCAPEREFQIRARQIGGPRTKRLFLAADGMAHAREVAGEHLGDGWEILDASEAGA